MLHLAKDLDFASFMSVSRLREILASDEDTKLIVADHRLGHCGQSAVSS